MKLYVKNMVCNRCKTAVKNELDKLHIAYDFIELGEISLEKPVTIKTQKLLKEAIEPLGFELIEDRSARQVNQMKKIIVEWVRGKGDERRKLKFSAYLQETLHKEYTLLSNLFSSIEGTTIEQYMIHQKIERVKELLVYIVFSFG